MNKKCNFCEREELLPFQCPFCGKYFCGEHHLPENHSCPDAPERTPLGHWQAKIRKPEPSQSPLPIRKTATPLDVNCPKCHSERIMVTAVRSDFNMRECLNCHHKWKSIGELPERNFKGVPVQKPPKPAKHSILTFCIILVFVGAVIAYSSYNFGFNSALSSHESDYQIGYERGYYDGNSSGYENGYSTAYDLGYVQGVEDGAGRGYNIRDPTHQEALDFIALDQTNKNLYDEEHYTCHHFTADVKNHAFQAGHRCGYVSIFFPDSAHAIVSFNTTDNGSIFIEPQWDDIVILTIGQSYSDINGYETPEHDDTIVSFAIIW